MTATFRGTVYNQTTGHPLEASIVEVIINGYSYMDKSGSDGTFTISNIPPCQTNCTLRAAFFGYAIYTEETTVYEYEVRTNINLYLEQEHIVEADTSVDFSTLTTGTTTPPCTQNNEHSQFIYTNGDEWAEYLQSHFDETGSLFLSPLVDFSQDQTILICIGQTLVGIPTVTEISSEDDISAMIFIDIDNSGSMSTQPIYPFTIISIPNTLTSFNFVYGS